MNARAYGLAAAFLSLILCSAPALAQSASPAPSAAGTPATAAPASTVDPAITARAKTWLHRLQTGTVDAAARQELDAKVDALLTPALLKTISAKLGPLGDPTAFTFVGMQPIQGDNIAYIYKVEFKTGTIPEIFVLNKDGKVSGIQFPPPQ